MHENNPTIAFTNTLCTEVEPFYQALLKGISAAKVRVSMMYFTFDHWSWADKFAAAMGSNFELSLFLRDASLAGELSVAFDRDAAVSTLHNLGDFSHRSFFSRTLAHVSRLAAPWMWDDAKVQF